MRLCCHNCRINLILARARPKTMHTLEQFSFYGEVELLQRRRNITAADIVQIMKRCCWMQRQSNLKEYELYV